MRHDTGMLIPIIPSILYECYPVAPETITTKPLLHEQASQSEVVPKRHFELGFSAGTFVQLFALVADNAAVSLLAKEHLIESVSLPLLAILVAVLSGVVVVITFIVLRFLQSTIYSAEVKGGKRDGPASEFFDGALVGVCITLVVTIFIHCWWFQIICFLTALMAAMVWCRLPKAISPMESHETESVAVQGAAFVV